MMICSKGTLKREKWWTITFKERYDYDQTYIEETILTLLEDATRIRMMSDVPIGAYLSGGVDSSSVVALMSRYADKPIKTFSLGYEDDLKNKQADLYSARRVSRAFKTDHYEYMMSYKEVMDGIGDVIAAFDQPFSGTISTYFISSLIRAHVGVALSGDGSDELFGSYLSHRVAQPIYHYKTLREKALCGTLNSEDNKLLQPCDISFLEDLYRK